jgi:uncharacterized integral membrane protein
MVKIIFTVAMLAVVVVFGLQNSDHVSVSLVIGAPVQIRLVFLLLITAGLGYLLAYIHGIKREIALKKLARKQQVRAAVPRSIEDAEDLPT